MKLGLGAGHISRQGLHAYGWWIGIWYAGRQFDKYGLHIISNRGAKSNHKFVTFFSRQYFLRCIR